MCCIQSLISFNLTNFLASLIRFSAIEQVRITCDSLAKLLGQDLETLLLVFERLFDPLELPLSLDNVTEQSFLAFADLLDIAHVTEECAFFMWLITIRNLVLSFILFFRQHVIGQFVVVFGANPNDTRGRALLMSCSLLFGRLKVWIFGYLILFDLLIGYVKTCFFFYDFF